jgi:thiamine-monophosphate kinase
VSLLDEHAVIERLTRRLSIGRSGLWSVGDDGARLAAEDRLVVTDAMVQGRHFDLRWSSWSDVGFKLLARNVSDIFAMGGRPTAMLLTLALPSDLSAAALDAFAEGLEAASACWCNPVLIGGDTTSVEGPAVLTLTLFGKPGPRLLARSGGRAGDRLWVDGGCCGTSPPHPEAAAPGCPPCRSRLHRHQRWPPARRIAPRARLGLRARCERPATGPRAAPTPRRG